MNKLGSYVTKLMTTILDSTRLNVDINDFIRKHHKDMYDKVKEQQEKQLLQEDKKNVKDK